MPVSYSPNYRATKPVYGRRSRRSVRRRLPWGAFFAGVAVAVVLKHGVAARIVSVSPPPESRSVRAVAPRKVQRRVPVPADRGKTPSAIARTTVAGTRRAAAAGTGGARRLRKRWDASIHAHPKKGQYHRFYRMKVTAYTPINTRMEGGRWTKTARDGRSAHGVAVDPDLIPLGTRLWIPGYGHAIADDTGGRIKGHRVDLRMQNAEGMRRWGVRPVRVYVLSDPQDS